MGKECEEIQIIALTEALQVNVCIVYLDNKQRPDNEPIQQHVFSGQLTSSESPSWSIYLLYRPGHYDILYRKSK